MCAQITKGEDNMKVAVWNYRTSEETFVQKVSENQDHICFQLGSIWNAAKYTSAEARRIAARMAAQFATRGERCRVYTL